MGIYGSRSGYSAIGSFAWESRVDRAIRDGYQSPRLDPVTSKDALMPRTQFFALAILAFGALASFDSAAAAQEIRWRQDYTAARRESVETGKPLFVDFSTESCFWCKKLDAVTWRDPKIVKLLNEQFIPVKLDGEKETRLVQSLQVDGYPTLIVATAEGKVVGRHAGFLDAAQMTSLLRKAPAAAKAAAP